MKQEREKEMSIHEMKDIFNEHVLNNPSRYGVAILVTKKTWIDAGQDWSEETLILKRYRQEVLSEGIKENMGTAYDMGVSLFSNEPTTSCQMIAPLLFNKCSKKGYFKSEDAWKVIDKCLAFTMRLFAEENEKKMKEFKDKAHSDAYKTTQEEG